MSWADITDLFVGRLCGNVRGGCDGRSLGDIPNPFVETGTVTSECA